MPEMDKKSEGVMTKQQEKILALTKKLEDGVKDLFKSPGQFQDYLKQMAQFHRYSFNNSMLIFKQNPEATLVAGLTTWNKKFRHVIKQGEHGIQIFAPTKYKTATDVAEKDPDTGKEKLDSDGKPITKKEYVEKTGYRVAYVYDVSQVQPVPGAPELMKPCKVLEGAMSNIEDLKETLEVVAGVPVEYGPINGEANGYYVPVGGLEMIKVKEGLSDEQTVKTLVHEISHSRINSPNIPKEKQPSRADSEMTVESVAYVVCEHLGIDSSQYSFPYIATWSEGKELKDLSANMNLIRRTADELINELDAKLVELHPEKYEFLVANDRLGEEKEPTIARGR